MAAIVYQTDKRSGITYAYQSVSYWDKEKKQSRARHTLIGRVDKETGEIVPTDGRNRKKQDEVPAKREPIAAEMVHRSFYGATYLLDAIGEQLGITHDLKQCFPDTYKQILSTVHYLLEELDILGYSKVKLVMDRGFFSEYNINCLYRDHIKFILSVRMSLAFDRRLIALKQELESGKRIPEYEKLYQKYFTIKATLRRGTQVTVREENVRNAKRYYGFFALITNETMDAVTALELYCNKDVVEKVFGNLKERLNMRRALVSSEQSLEGKLFVQFVALIYLSYIKKQMQVKGLLKDYTLSALLDKLDVIECFEQSGKSLRVGEMLEK